MQNGAAGNLAMREAQSQAYLIIIFYHHQGQFTLFKIHFGDFGPGQREKGSQRHLIGSNTTYTTRNGFFFSFWLKVGDKDTVH